MTNPIAPPPAARETRSIAAASALDPVFNEEYRRIIGALLGKSYLTVRPLAKDIPVIDGVQAQFAVKAAKMAEQFKLESGTLPSTINGRDTSVIMPIDYLLSPLRYNGPNPGFLYIQARELFKALKREGVEQIVLWGPEIVNEELARSVDATTLSFDEVDFRASEQFRAIGRGLIPVNKGRGIAFDRMVEIVRANVKLANGMPLSEEQIKNVTDYYMNEGGSKVWFADNQIRIIAQAAKELGLDVSIAGFEEPIDYSQILNSSHAFYAGVQKELPPEGAIVENQEQFVDQSKRVVNEILQVGAATFAPQLLIHLSKRQMSPKIAFVGTSPIDFKRWDQELNIKHPLLLAPRDYFEYHPIRLPR